MKKRLQQILAAVAALDVDVRELARDGLALAGLGLLAGGVLTEFGSGWSMMVVGLALLGVVFAPRRP